ncbi:CPBP family glutamic-type intramembrane protease [Anaerobaca lacustris]|uniref:CPBP family glutamic-type intramembrane protease n=1 Tax=Anaerobaca lacustris TaxID=3044600 RepID=A0AAW6TV79_9BACT|nr:CPBP family glutamic-type intramembrane protease [Sedimentisphaerales bacterium M17dextr]
MAGRKKNESKPSYSTSQLLNYESDSYLERTSRPVYAIVFLLPFIIFYEIGTILINTDMLNRSQVRVVAFVWLQQLLQYLGTSSRIAWIAPPLVVILILIGLQLASRKRWYFCAGDYIPMVVECMLLAVPLIVLSLFFNSRSVAPDGSPRLDGNTLAAVAHVVDGRTGGPAEPVRQGVAPLMAEAKNGGPSLMANIVTGVGAGIYEELVFRLILICLLMMLFQDLLGLSHANAIVSSVLISAALFSAHHHIVVLDGQFGCNAPFNWTEFSFRTIAGVYFAALFAIRGFGITAGTHAFYDIIATLINALVFDH